MSAIRSILLHLDATSCSAKRVAIAQGVAAKHGSRVTALFGVRSDAGTPTYAYSAGAALRAAEEGDAMPHVLERSRLRSQCEHDDTSFQWCEIFGDTVTHGFLAEASYADLLIVGQQAAEGTGSAPPGFLESVILESGVPAIVVPRSQRLEILGRRMLLAWDGSAASARAVRAALPFLTRADKVHVATWAAHAPTAPYSRIDISTWLDRHGIVAEIHRHPPTRHFVDELASMVTRLETDLVVMGCYGHSRMRERVFGGATRAWLGTLPVPVLMTH